MKLHNFKDYLKLNVDTKSTQINYYNRVKCFFDLFDEFNQANINAFLSKRLDKISMSTFNQTITAFNHFAKMVNIEFVFPKYKKITSKEKDYLTEEELTKELLPYFKLLFIKESDYFSFIIKFLFYTGVRPIEMCKLKTTDIDFKNNIFICRDPKNHKDKKVPFPSKLGDLMKRYLQVGMEKAFQVNYSTMDYIFLKLNKELRYKKHLNPYMLRHSFAHYVLDNGVPIEKLQILMGHAELKTTMIYAKPKVEDALSSYFENIKPKGL